MSTALRHSPITVEQYEHFQGYPGLRDELIFGEIVLSSQPKPLHQQIAENIHRALQVALRAQAFTVKQNTNIRFREAHSMPAPDVLVIGRDVWLTACKSDSYLSEPPILVVEVMSPANRKKRVDSKVQLYLTQGVNEVWLVSPKRQTVQVLRTSPTKLEQQYSIGQSIELPKPLVGRVDLGSVFAFDS